MFLFVVSFFLVPGWAILFQVCGSLWIRSVWPLHSWVDPAGPLPAYVTVAAFWVALVLQARYYLGLAEEAGSFSAFGHWSVRRSCTVFGLVNSAAWGAYAFLLNLVLAATSVEPSSEPLALETFAEFQIVITATLAFAIAVPNYGHLPVTWMMRQIGSMSSWWRAWRDHRFLGKELGAPGVGAQPRRRRTKRTPIGPSEPVDFPSDTAGFWLASAAGLGEELKALSKPRVVVEQDKCSVCGRSVSVGERVLRCPRCSARAHERHFLKWLRDNAGCPRCRTPLSPYDLVED